MIPAGKYLSKVSNETNRKLIVDMVSASRWKSGFCLLLKSYRGIGIALDNRHFSGQGFPWNDHGWAVNEIGKVIFTKLYLCLWISELVRDIVCVCVCVLQALGRSREGMNSQICLTFGTRIAWVNPWGCFFSVFENFDFWVLGTQSWSLTGPKSFRAP